MQRFSTANAMVAYIGFVQYEVKTDGISELVWIIENLNLADIGKKFDSPLICATQNCSSCLPPVFLFDTFESGISNKPLVRLNISKKTEYENTTRPIYCVL